MEVGLAVAGAALNVFFDRIAPNFPNLFQGRKGDEQLLRKLKITLLAVSAVLSDAEDKQNTNMDVKQWLAEVKDTVYHAEDLVDEINTEVLRLEVEGGERSVAYSVSQLSDEFLKEIFPKIEEVVTTLEYLVSQINVLGLERVVTKKDYPYRLPSTSLVDESEVCGRDNEIEKLLQMVLSDGANGNNVSVIPIVGMGGIGKTTLAQVVYGDERVKKHFDTKAWCCVSENYDAFRITRSLVNQVTDLGSEEKDDFNTLQVKLKESLAKKKFLIILDDIWHDNYNDWDKLRAPLKYGKQGSKIIVTTRNEKIAFMIRTEPIHYLEPILEDDCWSLFKKHAFDKEGTLASPEFEKIGKEIVQKCNGLPLAVKTLGGLLRSKKEIKEWDHILKSEFWSSENESNDVLPVLKLSYHHLLPHLKHCFAFCALFPKNHHFNEKELVLLWMANDLLQHQSQNDKTIEDLGREYLNELRSRSFFQKVSDDKYSMHDLVNDLAKYVCGKFCVRLEDYRHCEIPSEVRHFSYMSEDYNASKKFKFLSQVKSLRTFFPVAREQHDKLTQIFLSDILPGLGRLRVLSLCNYDIKQFPNSICKLKHLRNLNLSRTSIEQLPDAICNLYNLQTLLLIECENLHKLPMNFTKLVNLRHLDLSGTELSEMPSHMSRLKNLQTLSYFIVGSSPGSNIEELGKLDLHRYLKIMGLQNVINGNDALKANLRNKKHLEDLVLQWSRDIDDSQIAKDILDKLQPHTNLKGLTIDWYGGTSFSQWLGNDSFCNIESLCLTNCRNCFMLPTLGHLASLKSLTISGLDNITKVGQELYGDGSLPFKSLVTLKIEEMSEWEEWNTSGNVKFSRLEELYIKKCPKLKGELPSELLCLKKIEIFKCPKLVFPVNWMTHDNQGENSDGWCISNEHLKATGAGDSLNDTPLGLFPKLQTLELSDCESLKIFPRELQAPNLEYFKVWNCKKLKSLPEQMHSLLPSLREFFIYNCPEIECFSEGGLPSSLETLCIISCKKLMRCPRDWGLQRLPALTTFSIDGGDDEYEEESFPDEWLLPSSLRVLIIQGNKKLKTLNEKGLLRLTSLQTLRIYKCPNLVLLPKEGLLTSLQTLDIWNCPNLVSLPKEGLPTSLQTLRISNCPNLVSLPKEGLPTSLRTLSISSCANLVSLPKEGLPTSLQTLEIYNCTNLVSLPKEGLPTSLQTLYIFECPNLVSLPEEGLPTSLQTLYINNCPNLVSLPKEGLPTSLQTLLISNCPNLVSLPKEGLLTSLQTLYIDNCPNLKSLPEEGLPTSLSKLHVTNCPLLKQHLERERGKYWPNIAHIPIIEVDKEFIS